MNIFDLIVKIAKYYEKAGVVGTFQTIMNISFFVILMSLTCDTSESETGANAPVVNISPKKTVDKYKKAEAPRSADTNFIFYKIPTDKMEKFFELRRLKDNDSTSTYRESNEQFWSFVREVCENNLEVYKENGIVYSWQYCIINSNNVAIANIGQFDIDRKKYPEYFAKYKRKLGS